MLPGKADLGIGNIIGEYFNELKKHLNLLEPKGEAVCAASQIV